MRIHALLAAVALVATGAIASTPSPDAVARAQAKLDHMLAGRVAGPPERCLLQSQVRESTSLDGIGVLYRMGSTYYLNRPRTGADAIAYDPILASRTPTGLLCEGDTVKLIDRSSRIATDFLILGDFVPYRRGQ